MPDPRIFPITTVNDTSAHVTDVSAVILPWNDRRRDLEIVNDSDVVVYIARSGPAIVGQGMRLNPNGGSYSMDMQNMYWDAFYAVCALGEDGSVTISEGLI